MADNTVRASEIDNARKLLDRFPAIQHRCDLDLLVFFARHWRVLLSSEQLAGLLGYPLKEIARSRDVLVAAGLLTRAQDSTRPQRMYVFAREGMNGGPLPAIVMLASTPGGRLALRQALASVPARERDGVPAQAENHRTRATPPPPDGVSPTRSRSREVHSNEPPERTQ